MNGIHHQEDRKFENALVIGVPSFRKNRNTLVGSYVVIPKSHVHSPFELTLDEWIATKAMMDVIKHYVDEKYCPDGYMVGWNVGQAAGQTVEYAHLHIIPRFKDEPLAGKGIRYWIKQDGNIRASLSNQTAEEPMTIQPLVFGDALWEPLAEYAQNCSWKAGAYLAKQMSANAFTDWERVFVALEGSNIAGYCTLAKTDCIPNVPYTPYIGFMFVGEAYRGHRLSEKLIRFALQYARTLNFEKVYLVSDHVNLYEKYGFVEIDKQPAPWDPNTLETIFVHAT